MDDNDARTQPGSAYVVGQLATAFVTALSHEDPETRRRAEERLRRWEQVLGGMTTGALTIGSRAPVAGLPAWVTPEVVRGGFTTGAAAAGKPLLPCETEAAWRVGIPADRRALFTYHLTEPGLAELDSLLDTGRYGIEVPEEAALLTVAWLLRSGDRLAALLLLDDLEPFADRLRFTPEPSDVPAPESLIVSRETAGEALAVLAARRPNERVEAMREALAVWNPFADELLEHWLATAEADQIAQRMPPGWLERSAALLERYRVLAAAHTQCSKHRKPKENLAILRMALEEVVAGRPLTPRQRGLLQHAVDAMVARRGRPGSDEHTGLRARQTEQAARPTHHALAQIVADRLSTLPQHEGVPSTEPLVQPVQETEAHRTGVPAGSTIPRSIQRVVDRALSGPIEELVAHGVIPSAEVLARLMPQITAATTAMAYPDPALRRLMTATYRAFRNRRSLLLLNLEHQVRIDELPWVQAVATRRRSSGDARQQAREVLVRLGELAIGGFPATILPNPLIRELDTLVRAAGLELPFVEELAADIFMGTFSAKFLRAAKLAAEVLGGTLYERYYGIDYRAILAIDDTAPQRRRWFAARTFETFDSLCRTRSGARADEHSVAANGMVIEQAQILTTHNLATLAGPLGVAPAAGWPDLALRCFATVCRLVSQLSGNPRPLVTVKDTAYAWRQMLFFLSLSSPDDQAAFVRLVQDDVLAQPRDVTTRLAPVLVGLGHVVAGGRFDRDGTAGLGRRFLGWSVSGHWMLRPAPTKLTR